MSTILKITRSIDNDIWKIVFSVDSTKFSETDKQLIAKFGEPEINVGGTFLGPTPGQENQTYTAVSGTSNGAGTGATFTIARNELGKIAGVEVISSGVGYLPGDIITIPGTVIGGTSPADDLVITIDEVEISDPSGSVVNFVGTGSTISTITGQENQTYVDVLGTTSGAGTGATFTLGRDSSGTINSVVLGSPGSGYLPGDIITIPGTVIGGTSPADDLIITVATITPVNLSGEVDTFTNSAGTTLGPTPGQENQTYTAVSGTSDGAGTGATFTITRDTLGAISDVTLVDVGTGYLDDEVITIPGTVIGGTSPADDLVITVTEALTSNVGEIVTFSNSAGTVLGSTSGQENQTYVDVFGAASDAGTGATFTISRDSAGAISSVTLVSPGIGYVADEVITIPGTSIGGASPADDLVITVTNVIAADLSGEITTFNNTAGTTLGPTPGQENQTYTAVSGTSNGAGTGATFTITRDAAGALTSITLAAGGTGYIAGEIITVPGSAVGGVVPADNVVITVNSVNPIDLAGSIVAIEPSEGTTLGPVSDPNEYTLPEKYIKIRSGLPFVQEFDSRGTGGMFSNNTQIKAEAFQEVFVARYTEALTNLRNNTDSFTKELLINI